MAAAAAPPIFIDASTLRSLLTPGTLIHHLQTSLPNASSTTHSPLRHHHQTSPTASLLLMPSWSLSPSLPYTGVKLVTHHPLNTSSLPSIHASYVLFHSLTGQTMATLDGTELTLHRTASISALASLYLSRPNSQTLLMVGAGALAPHLIKAHLTVRPSLNRVIIWNRNFDKAKALVDNLKTEAEFTTTRVCFESSKELEAAVGVADIISCATNSEAPLVMGAGMKAGAHLDLVGSFKESMRECDDEAVRRGRVFVDNEAAVEEAGELVGAFKRGVIGRSDVVGDLVELVKGEKVGRRDEEEVTVFKSVGSAVVDLVSAQLVYETFIKFRRMLGLSYSPGVFTRRLLLFQFPRRKGSADCAVVCAAKGPRPRYPRVWKTNKKIGTISKSVKLVECIKGLSNVKEEVYGALDSFIAWELEFPLITVKKALKTLENMREWKRIIQVTKWMLSKGQGRTMGSYYVLLNALAEEGRLDEAEELWQKLFSENLESTPRMFYDKMTSIYYRRGMHDKMFEVFADMEELGIRPTPSIVEMVGETFQKLGMIDKYKKLKHKYPPPKWEYRYIKGKRVKIKASQLRKRGDASDGLHKLDGGTDKEPNGSYEDAEVVSDELEDEVDPSDDSDPSSDELGEAANSCPETTI